MNVLHMPLPVAVRGGRDLREVRHPLRHIIEALERIREASLTRQREHVQYRVRRTAHRHVERDRIVDRPRGYDVGEGDPLVDELHQRKGRVPRQGVPFRRRRENRPVPGQRDAKRLAQAVHRVRREHAATTAARWTRRRFQLGEPRVVDRAGDPRPHALEDGDEIDFAATAIDPRLHRSTGDENRGQVHPRGADEHSGNDLVTVRNADHRVEAMRPRHRLDGISNELARRQ